jgi:membrane protein YqaA with SNARE-associated domain
MLVLPENPVIFLILLILLDTAFGIVPLEISIVYGLSIPLTPMMIGVIGLVFTVLGALIDYAIGYAGSRLITLSPKEEEKGKRFFDKYGSWGLFLARMIPFFPSKPVSIIAGGMRYSVAYFSFYTGFGAFLRFYLEAMILQPYYINNAYKTAQIVQKAHEYITNPAHYGATGLLIVLGIGAYYILVMRRGNG